MGKNIGDVAKMFSMTSYAIRYYDKIGLLSGVQRLEGGKRSFSQEDIDCLSVIRCLKDTGMSMNDIKAFMEVYSLEGNHIPQKRAMIEKQKSDLEEKVKILQKQIEHSDFKLWFFDNIAKNGVEPPYSDESYESWIAEFKKFQKNKK